MKRYIPVLLAAGFFVGSIVGPAAASNVGGHILGGDGAPPVLDANCKRAVVNMKAGSSWADGGKAFTLAGFNVTGNQIHCLIRRKAKSDQCINQLGAVPMVTEKADHGPGKPGDEIGAKDLRNYVAALSDCVTTK